MGRKYIGQVNNQNFVYPNYEMTEYDREIVHDINNNCISGTVTSLSATTISSSSITFRYNGTFNYNGSDPFNRDIATPIITTPYLSVHCQVPGQTYMNTWRLVDTRSTSYTGTTIPTTGSWTGDTFTITPANFGLSIFSGGTYYFEFRFIAEKCLYKICSTLNVNITTPTPTPTTTGSTPTPTPTSTPQNDCFCFPIVVTGSTLPPPEGGIIATLIYNDCFGTQVARAFTQGPGTYYQCIEVLMGVPQYDPIGTQGIDQSYINLTYLTGNCKTGYVCSGYVPSGATPTPTATVGPTATPTPTPTATGVPATATPTPTPTATGVPLDCVTQVTFDVDSAGVVGYLNCCGTSVTGFYGIGPQVINDCIDVGTLTGAGATISNITYGNTSCSCITPTATPTPTATGVPPTATPTPTATGVPPTATPTATPIPFSMTVYTGNSLSTACASSTPQTVYYSGSLGIGTILYQNSGYTSPIVPSVWLKLNDSTVYVVGTPSPEDGYITAIESCPTPTPTPGPTATPTPTPVITSFGGCGYGSTSGGSCTDAGLNNRTLYSNCDGLTFGIGCYVYVDTFPNPLTGYDFVYINLSVWNINSSTGQITGLASEQC